MKKLIITFLRQYRKRETGKLVFVYKVSGDEKAMAAYKESKGKHWVEDKTDGVLFFTPRYAQETATLREGKDKDGKPEFVVDDTKAAKIQSLVEQYGKETAEIMLNMQLGEVAAQ